MMVQVICCSLHRHRFGAPICCGKRHRRANRLQRDYCPEQANACGCFASSLWPPRAALYISCFSIQRCRFCYSFIPYTYTRTPHFLLLLVVASLALLFRVSATIKVCSFRKMASLYENGKKGVEICTRIRAFSLPRPETDSRKLCAALKTMDRKKVEKKGEYPISFSFLAKLRTRINKGVWTRSDAMCFMDKWMDGSKCVCVRVRNSR